MNELILDRVLEYHLAKGVLVNTEYQDYNSCPSCSTSIFRNVTTDSLNSLQKNKVTIHYKAGDTLFHQGTPSFGVYCIEKGKVKLSRVNQAGFETILFIATAGELIGHQCNVSDSEYLSTAKALDDCTASFITNEYFHQFITSHPQVAVDIIEQIMERNEMISSYGHASIHMTAISRVANLIMALAKRFGIKVNQKIKIDLRLTRQEMGSMVGMASETVIRSLTELKHQGILEQQGNFILINDLNELNKRR